MSPQCQFKRCILPALTSSSARVDIKSVVPKAGLSNLKSLYVAWKRNGEATFHIDCWKILLKASKKPLVKGNRKRKNPSSQSDDEIHLCDSEKIMIRHANKTVEKFDAEEDIAQEAERVANMILKSSHCVFFTGAGISTSAGLGDFRGKGGKWTEQDRETINIDTTFEEDKDNHEDKHAQSQSEDKEALDEGEEEEEEDDINYENLRPTFTHEAIAKLVENGHLKHIVSQNCDGLHILSGVPSEKISELHGNVFVEMCEKCDARYERSYYVCDDISDIYLEELADYGVTNVIPPKHMEKCTLCGLCHRTGRRCEKKKCNGYLIDTIINFRDNLDKDILDKAFETAMSCDLLVCLGTTLTVTPASHIVDLIKNPKRIVICNRQTTDRDSDCLRVGKDGEYLGARIFGDCDTFMRHLMSKLLKSKEHKKFLESLSVKAKDYDKKRKN